MGTVIREAEPGDALAIARVHVRSWQVGYRGLLPDDWLDKLRVEERAARYTLGSSDPRHPKTKVALEQEVIVGFATTAPARDPDAQGKGELAALYVDPVWWNHGIGRSLVAAARAQLVAQGFPSAVLWLLVGNDRGHRLYASDGWRPDGSRRTVEAWGRAVDEIRYQRSLT